MTVTQSLEAERSESLEMARKAAEQAVYSAEKVLKALEKGDPGVSCIDAIELLTRCATFIGKARATNTALDYCSRAGV